MSRLLPLVLAVALSLTGLGATCTSRGHDVTRENAIAVARSLVSFNTTSIEAERTTDEGRRVWRVRLRGAPMSPDHPLLRPITIVLIDARTGDIVSVAKS